MRAGASAREVAGPGTYALVLSVGEELRTRVGSLGELRFPPGTYVHAGSAPAALHRHVDRILEGRGGRRHVDRLVPLAGDRWGLAFPGSEDACELATHVARLPGALPVLGFGSTACTCLTHLHGFLGETPPGIGPHLEGWGRARGVEAIRFDAREA